MPKKRKPPELFKAQRVWNARLTSRLRVKKRLCSAEANLGEDALAGQQLGAEADHKAQHGQAAVPGFSEVDEAEAVGVFHGV